MIELRPKISGSYKGLLYCRGVDQAKRVEESLKSYLGSHISKPRVKIKRGCSEFTMEIPFYGEISDNKEQMMQYPATWRSIEQKFDTSLPIKPKKNIISSLNGLCVSDFLIIRKWIDYAKGQGDPSAKLFQSLPIKYSKIFHISQERKAI